MRAVARDRVVTVNSTPRTFLQVWSRRTAPERFDAYTRWSLYVLSAFEPFLALALVGIDPTCRAGPLRVWILLVLVHTVASIATLRAGMRHFLGGPSVRPWLLGALAALTAALAAVAFWTFPVGSPDDVAASARFYALLLGPAFGVLAVVPLLTFRRLALVALGLAALTGCSVWVGTGPVTATTVGMAVGLGLSCALMLVAIFGSYRASVWMLGVVWEIDRSRVLHARLAVAEERLRFSRDLHDVFGRTLSVVAVSVSPPACGSSWIETPGSSLPPASEKTRIRSEIWASRISGATVCPACSRRALARPGRKPGASAVIE